MDNALIYYLFCLAVLIVGILVIKKITGCILKSIALIVVVVILVAIWYLFLR